MTATKVFTKIQTGVHFVPNVTTQVATLGDVDSNTTDNKLYYHNGTIASPLVTEAGGGLLSGKTIGTTNTVNLLDGSFTLQNTTTPSKHLNFDLSNIAPSTSAVLAVPTFTSDTLVLVNATQTVANKTLTNANITLGATLNVNGNTITNGSGVLTLPTTTDTLVGRDTTDLLANKSFRTIVGSPFTDSTTTGSNATLDVLDVTNTLIRLTNVSLTSISGIPAGVAGQRITITNLTGATISINDNDVGAAFGTRIRTGTGGTISLSNTASYDLVYFAPTWDIVSVSASGVTGLTTANLSPTAGILGTQLANNTITSANLSPTAGILGTQLANNTITRTQEAAVGEQLSSSCGSFTTSSTSFVPVPNLSVTITTTGRPVEVKCISAGTSLSYIGLAAPTGTAEFDAYFEINRNGTPFAFYQLSVRSNTTATSLINIPSSVIATTDTSLAAGTYTYTVTMSVASGVSTGQFVNAKLLAYEL